MRCNGLVLSPQKRRRYRAIRGDVRVTTEARNEIGRSSNVPKGVKDMPLEPELLPSLLDAILAGRAPT